MFGLDEAATGAFVLCNSSAQDFVVAILETREEPVGKFEVIKMEQYYNINIFVYILYDNEPEKQNSTKVYCSLGSGKTIQGSRTLE